MNKVEVGMLLHRNGLEMAEFVDWAVAVKDHHGVGYYRCDVEQFIRSRKKDEAEVEL